MEEASKHVVVLVLGDIGRSPRMQYHAISLAEMPDTRVTVVGYEGERCVPQLLAKPNIALRTFAPIAVSRKLFVLSGPLKVLLQLFQLFWLLLFCVGSFDVLLVQNPPTIPTLYIGWLSCKLKRAKLVIDWHNMGYTVLALSIGQGHVFVKIARWFERFFGRRADGHFCVTEAMQLWLQDNWDISPVVLYDKPPAFFQPTPLDVQHDLLVRLDDAFAAVADLVPAKPNATWRTELLGSSSFKLRNDRPALVISSTSWTEDEDFGLLFDALVLFEEVAKDRCDIPSLVVAVTGKGPQKAMYLERIAALKFQRVRIVTLWLEASDYPLLLGAADLGICLHTSTSGLDLPMKVLDMFGCRVPVCAVGFNCLNELIKHDKNGLVFQRSEELCDQLIELLTAYPKNETLTRYRANLSDFEHWPENWSKHAAPVFDALMAQHYDETE
ncbi:hypothetical protein SDRG_04081 [Saprolegnia diclina VS20]|uniref:Chitobiosyldiphosphodolichol beta-mannosyltransferase n=2 Tax=Saprolegnia diclina (strain VS20) TaxID=1156394 RepID=T0S6I6_SAPDV|nr:hypothetical protein SDRG_04081 [Saprolegnia diclina VS20]EQC38367.1 hypothetical protein SDRG_04081 [Saprolegnia diclina VS20]|eukprot:XP_008607959.1 hypothetical protein SDRG_04081 [Saprolegnia diclina VS20]